MPLKNKVMAFVVILVVCAVGNFIIHGLLLQPAYHQSAILMRGEQDSQAHAMFLMVGFLFFSLAFVWLYGQLKQTGSWVMDGLQFAIAVWFMATISRYSIYYAIQPWPAGTVLLQIGYELVLSLTLGLAAGFLLQEKKQ